MEKSLILAFVSELYFSSLIEIVAEKLGYSLVVYGKIEDVLKNESNEWVEQYAEHLVGQGSVLIEVVTESRPVLMIFDLNNGNIPWKNWISLIKSAPATRRIPIVGFGSHMEDEKFRIAKSAGADRVIARSKFVRDLPQIIKKLAFVDDLEAIEISCKEKLSLDAIRGLEEFNRGKYFEAHEHLEQAWLEDQSPGRELYRAILQVGVAYLQIQRGNYRGTMKMFLRVRQWIDPLPDTCRGINVSKLRNDAYEVQRIIAHLGVEGMSQFDFHLLKPVEYIA